MEKTNMNYKLLVIPEAETKNESVLVLTTKGIPLFIGDSNDNYLCGVCNTVICENVARGQFSNLVFKCSNCGAFNKVRGT